MHPDPIGEGRRWLAQARADFVVAEQLRGLGQHFASCFYAQQSAEKALKGALLALSLDPGKTHSVVLLAQALEAAVPGHAGLTVRVGLLDQYYVPTRYPDALPGGIPAQSYVDSDSERALDAARRAIAAAAIQFP